MTRRLRARLAELATPAGIESGTNNILSALVLFLTGLVLSAVRTRPRPRQILEDTNTVLQIGWRPVVVVSVPVGMVLALNFDSMMGIVGMRDLASIGLVPALVREMGPLFAGLLAATTAGAAFSADIGARRTRDEISASEVMAVDPRARLYVPKILALVAGTPILALFGTVAALVGGWVLVVALRAGSGGAYLSSFETILRIVDPMVLVIKAAVYGLVCGVSATFFGDRAKGGPSGVADATRYSIITSYIVIAIVGFVINRAFYGVSGTG